MEGFFLECCKGETLRWNSHINLVYRVSQVEYNGS